MEYLKPLCYIKRYALFLLLIACTQTEVIEREVTVTTSHCDPTSVVVATVTRPVCDLTPPVPPGTFYDTIGIVNGALLVIEYVDSTVYPNAQFDVEIGISDGNTVPVKLIPEDPSGYHRWWVNGGAEINEASPSIWLERGYNHYIRHRHHFGGACEAGRSININL